MSSFGQRVSSRLRESAEASAKALIINCLRVSKVEPDNVVQGRIDGPRSRSAVSACCGRDCLAGRQGFEPRNAGPEAKGSEAEVTDLRSLPEVFGDHFRAGWGGKGDLRAQVIKFLSRSVYATALTSAARR